MSMIPITELEQTGIRLLGHLGNAGQIHDPYREDTRLSVPYVSWPFLWDLEGSYLTLMDPSPKDGKPWENVE